MPRLKQAGSRSFRHSFARVYDALYGGDTPFLQAQIAFLTTVFGPPSGALLDLGCGTGLHLAALSRLDYTTVGVDCDPFMLQAARRNARQARLVLADLRRLPFTGGFNGALCLESPLAYLLDDADLASALKCTGDALSDGGRLVIDVYDYVETLGMRRIAPREAHFESDSMRVTVWESHDYRKTSRIWTMWQRFEVEEAEGSSAFEVSHRLRIRTLDEYARALETAGFRILEALTAYPSTPEALWHEGRLIIVARR